MLYSEEKQIQVIIQYAGRTTPLITDIKSIDTRKFIERINDVWPKFVDSFASNNSVFPAGTLVALQKKLFTQSGDIFVNSLRVMENEFILDIPRKLNGKRLQHFNEEFWLKNKYNDYAARVIGQLYDVFGYEVHRVGKIYQIAILHDGEDGIQNLYNQFNKITENKVSEVHNLISFIKEKDSHEYNVVFKLDSKIETGTFDVLVDINNRNTESALSIKDMKDVFTFADSLMPEWLIKIFGE